MANNSLSQENMSFDLKTSGKRVGKRIRCIRIDKGLSQADLGEKVGLNADRIQKYENGQRKPKNDMLNKIAKALDVSVYALEDPVGTNTIGAMYTLFELEKNFDIIIERRTGNRPPGISITFDSKNGMYRYMEEWYNVYKEMKSNLEKAETDEEKKEAVHDYNLWKWSFPEKIKNDKKMKKVEIQKKIAELQEEYNQLDEE